MKPNQIAITLAFFLGSTGLQRFYAGQRRIGWLVLIICWLIIPISGIYMIRHVHLGGKHLTLIAWVTLILIVHIAETLYFLRFGWGKELSPIGFKGQITSTLAAILLPILMLSVFQRKALPEFMDVTNAKASYSLSARSLYDEFNRVENSSEQYLKQVLEITGVVLESGIELTEAHEEEQLIILQGDQDGFMGVKCNFGLRKNAGHHTFEEGDSILIKGICQGSLVGYVLMKDCILLKKY